MSDDSTIANHLSGPLEFFRNTFNEVMINILVAMLIFFIGFIFGRLIGRVLKKVLRHMNLDYFVRRTVGLKFSLEELIAGSVSYFIYVISFIMALNQLGLSTAILQMVIGGAIVIIVISIILSIKDFLPNIMAGMVLREKSFISENDIVRIKDIEGKVIELGLIETIIQNRHGDKIFIPNIVFTKNEVINYKPRKSKKTSSKNI